MGEGLSSRLVSAMTPREKAAQLCQVERERISPDQVGETAVGSVLSGAGSSPEPNTPADWRAMVDAYVEGSRRSRLGIPLLYGIDAVHGHNNVVGATIFPHNIALGATGNAELVEEIGRATGREVGATGIDWTFAPAVSVALDPRWGRTYESFGDDPALVARLGAALVTGLQAEGVAACLKHFVGDGGTVWGTVQRPPWIRWWDGWGDGHQIDQGDLIADEATLRSVHLHPYGPGLAAGAMSVMASYNSWNGRRLHGHRELLTGVLKDELRFDGLVVSDWMAVDQLDADYNRAVAAAIGAGIDLVMVPYEYERFIDAVLAGLDDGLIDPARVDDAVARNLAMKARLGLFTKRTRPRPRLEVVGCSDHRSLARRAVAESLVVLADPDHCLPLSPVEELLVAGSAADDIGRQCGGWTISWTGTPGPITDGSTIVDGLRAHGCNPVLDLDGTGDQRASTGLVVVAEEPYAEGGGDRADLAIGPADLALIHGIRSRVERLVLVVISGRPLDLTPVIDDCDTVVAAWLPGSEGAGVADVLLGASPVPGRLPRPWPGTTARAGWPRGHGLII